MTGNRIMRGFRRLGIVLAAPFVLGGSVAAGYALQSHLTWKPAWFELDSVGPKGEVRTGPWDRFKRADGKFATAVNPESGERRVWSGEAWITVPAHDAFSTTRQVLAPNKRDVIEFPKAASNETITAAIRAKYGGLARQEVSEPLFWALVAVALGGFIFVGSVSLGWICAGFARE